jgi:hypothetical protein
MDNGFPHLLTELCICVEALQGRVRIPGSFSELFGQLVKMQTQGSNWWCGILKSGGIEGRVELNVEYPPAFARLLLGRNQF